MESNATDAAHAAESLHIAVIGSLTLHRDVLAFVLDQDAALEVGLSLCSLDELDSPASGWTDVALLVLPDDSGVAVLWRSAAPSWSKQLASGDPILILGWDTPPDELRRLLRQAAAPRSAGNRVEAIEAIRLGDPDGHPGNCLQALTDRELEVLESLGEGRSAIDTATALGISPNTVRTHITNLLQKLGAHSRLEAVAMTRAHFAAERHRRDGPASDGLR